MQTINIMSDKKDEIKKENQNKVEENNKDADHSTETEENNKKIYKITLKINSTN